MGIDYLIFIVLSAGYVLGLLSMIGLSGCMAWFLVCLVRELLHW
jgi:hypothetical protein